MTLFGISYATSSLFTWSFLPDRSFRFNQIAPWSRGFPFKRNALLNESIPFNINRLNRHLRLDSSLLFNGSVQIRKLQKHCSVQYFLIGRSRPFNRTVVFTRHNRFDKLELSIRWNLPRELFLSKEVSYLTNRSFLFNKRFLFNHNLLTEELLFNRNMFFSIYCHYSTETVHSRAVSLR